MLVLLFFTLMAAACFYGLTRDAGVAGLVVLIGFLQDPVRKLMVGEPVLMTVMVGVVIACITLRRVLISAPAFIEPFSRWSTEIRLPLMLYFYLVFAQAIHSLVRYQSPTLTVLGSLFYIAPFIAIMVGYSQFQYFETIRKFLLVFCGLAIIVAASVVISFYGVESTLLNEVGSGLIIYDQGTALRAYSGLMRGSEISAWHMGACVCFMIILVIHRGSLSAITLSSLLALFLIAAIALTGRRKALLQIVIFVSIYFPLMQFYQGRLSNRLVLLAGAAVLSLLMFVLWFAPSLEATQFELYYARGTTVFGDASGRFTGLGLGSIGWAYNRYGLFGGGLGVATQGSQHLISGAFNGAGEGGLGKLSSELGLISLIIVPWVAYVFAKYIHRGLTLVAAVSSEKLALSVGITAFLFANIPTFIVASQAYGDVFILLILGLLSGALFAIPLQVQARLSEPIAAYSREANFTQTNIT